jgi:hypothetical protein
MITTRPNEAKLTKSQEGTNIKLGMAGLGHITGHNGVQMSCNKCHQFFGLHNLLATSHPLFRRVCSDCAPRYSTMMSKGQLTKLVKLQEARDKMNKLKEGGLTQPVV